MVYLFCWKTYKAAYSFPSGQLSPFWNTQTFWFADWQHKKNQREHTLHSLLERTLPIAFPPLNPQSAPKWQPAYCWGAFSSADTYQDSQLCMLSQWAGRRATSSTHMVTAFVSWWASQPGGRKEELSPWQNPLSYPLDISQKLKVTSRNIPYSSLLEAVRADRRSLQSSSFLSFCTVPSRTFSTTQHHLIPRETLEGRSVVGWFHKFRTQWSPTEQQRASKEIQGSNFVWDCSCFLKKNRNKSHVALDLEVWPLEVWRVEQLLSLEATTLGRQRTVTKPKHFWRVLTNHSAQRKCRHTAIARATVAHKTRSVLYRSQAHLLEECWQTRWLALSLEEAFGSCNPFENSHSNTSSFQEAYCSHRQISFA